MVPSPHAPVRIGVFDSGVGGIGVWREIVRVLPDAPTIYVADTAHAPYGDRADDEIAQLTAGGVTELLAYGASLVVLACNTASSVALERSRRHHPGVPFVGMEPAVKPAASTTRTRTVAVLATRATLRGAGFARLVARFANGARVVPCEGVGLVACVEAGEVAGERVEGLVRSALAPAIAAGADRIVLGCTHFPFLRDAIARVVGPDVDIVDPAPAVARRVAQLAAELPCTPTPDRAPAPAAGSGSRLRPGAPPPRAADPRVTGPAQLPGRAPQHRLIVSGDRAAFLSVADRLLGSEIARVFEKT